MPESQSFPKPTEDRVVPRERGRPDLAAPHPRSAALDELLQLFEARGVGILAWKGTPRSPETFSGLGDTDLLVAPGQRPSATQALADCGFRQVPSASWRRQPFVSDWFRVDPALGTLIHVQLYEKLVLGSAFDTQVEVPGAAKLFGRANGGYPAALSRADAAVLRLCRAALRRPYTPGRASRSLVVEAMDLADGLGPGELEAAASLFPPDTAAIILEAFSGAGLGVLRRRLLKGHRSAPGAGGGRLPSAILAGVARWNRSTLGLPILGRRKVLRPAPVIAVVGSDGSGKSTVAMRLAESLNQKFDTRLIYFGTGDGPASWYRQPLVALRRIRERGQGPKGHRPAPPGIPKPAPARQRIPSAAKALWALTVALERRNKMRRARRAAAAGWAVITDRFPQAEHPGIHDGPRLDAWVAAAGIRGLLARWERRVYQELAGSPPDLVLLLDVSPAVAQRRRPEESGEELARRIEVAAMLRFSGCPRRVIDADQPLAKVVGSALHEAFSRLCP